MQQLRRETLPFGWCFSCLQLSCERRNYEIDIGIYPRRHGGPGSFVAVTLGSHSAQCPRHRDSEFSRKFGWHCG